MWSVHHLDGEFVPGKEFYIQIYEGSLTELVEIFLSFSSPNFSVICIFKFWNMQ